MENFALFFFFFAIQNVPVYSASNSGPVGPIVLYDVMDCDPVVNKLNFDWELLIDGDDKKILDLSFDLDVDVDSKATFTLKCDKWNNNAWQEDVYNMDETPLLDFVEKNLNKTYTKIRKAIKPAIINAKKIPAGSYKLQQFHEEWQNVDLASILYGRWMVTLSLFINDEEKACLKVEAETFEE